MIITYDNWEKDIAGPSRMVKGKVELYKGSTLTQTFNPHETLSSIRIERTATQGKFFGYSISQKATVVLIGNDIAIDKDDEIKPYIGTETYQVPFPKFKITEVSRDEVKKQITITGYDIIGQAANHQQKEVRVSYPILLSEYINAVASALNHKVKMILRPQHYVDLQYTKQYPVNFSGEEDLRNVITQLAEATGTVVYADKDDNIVFKQIGGMPVYTIKKSQYFDLSVNETIHLTGVTKATELGDNVTAGTNDGFNQILFDNGFLNLLPNVDEALEQMVKMYMNVPYTPYDIKWRGNPALEIGDMVELSLDKDEKAFVPYVGETINYTGGMNSYSSWEKEENKTTHSNPTKVGDVIKQTYAKVDKANQKIDLVVKDVAGDKEAITQLQLSNGQIQSSVSNIEGDINTITQTLNGVAYKSSLADGTTVINGGCITTGTIDAQRLNLSGEITWGDLDTNLQNTINNSTAKVPDYLESTYINPVEIRSPTITGNDIKAKGYFQILNGNTVQGYMGKGYGLTGSGVQTYGVMLSAGDPDKLSASSLPYIIVTDAGVRIQSGNHCLYLTNGGISISDGNELETLVPNATVKAVWGV